LSHKNWAIGGIVFIVSLVMAIAFLAFFYAALQAINPIAVLTAAIVALIGIAWFKKTTS
jgi:hypothetical protein